MEEIVVQHCVLAVATEVRQRNAVGTYSEAEHEHTLYGVSYRYAVPQDMEFGADGNSPISTTRTGEAEGLPLCSCDSSGGMPVRPR